MSSAINNHNFDYCIIVGGTIADCSIGIDFGIEIGFNIEIDFNIGLGFGFHPKMHALYYLNSQSTSISIVILFTLGYLGTLFLELITIIVGFFFKGV